MQLQNFICPYSNCGKSFSSESLSEKDFRFLEQAIDSKMSLIFLHCPGCGEYFSFQIINQIIEKIYTNPVDNIKDIRTHDELMRILKEENITIPKNYLDYLLGDTFSSDVFLAEMGLQFYLYSLEDLLSIVTLDNREYLTIYQIQGYLYTMIGIFGEDALASQTFDLGDCLTIGYENTNLMLLDTRDNGALWIFHTDDGSYQKINTTLEKIIE